MTLHTGLVRANGAEHRDSVRRARRLHVMALAEHYECGRFERIERSRLGVTRRQLLHRRQLFRLIDPRRRVLEQTHQLEPRQFPCSRLFAGLGAIGGVGRHLQRSAKSVRLEAGNLIERFHQTEARRVGEVVHDVTVQADEVATERQQRRCSKGEIGGDDFVAERFRGEHLGLGRRQRSEPRVFRRLRGGQFQKVTAGGRRPALEAVAARLDELLDFHRVQHLQRVSADACFGATVRCRLGAGGVGHQRRFVLQSFANRLERILPLPGFDLRGGEARPKAEVTGLRRLRDAVLRRRHHLCLNGRESAAE